MLELAVIFILENFFFTKHIQILNSYHYFQIKFNSTRIRLCLMELLFYLHTYIYIRASGILAPQIIFS